MKKHLSKRLVALVLALVLCLSLVAPAGAYEESSGTNVKFEQVSNDLVSVSRKNRGEVQETPEAYAPTDEVRVSIVLEDIPAIYAASNVMAFAEDAQAVAYREVLAETQELMAEEISAETGTELDVVWNLTLAANIISANVQYGDIDTIRAIPGVSDVRVERRYEPAVVQQEQKADPNMATSSEQIGSGLAWAAGYTGAGSKVAVIDTGTDTDHQSFDADAFVYAIEQTGKNIKLMDADDIAAVLPQLNAAKRSPELTAENFYINEKLAFGYNYVDQTLNITHDLDSQGEHGSHVAGIATANRYINNGNGTFSDALDAVHTQGVAPDAQLITMKVFGVTGGAYDSDYMVAIEDAVVLGCDSINLSLGSANPGTSANSEELYQNILDNLISAGAVVSISAGNSGTWQEETSYGYLYSDGVNMQTDGEPGSYTNAFTVASVDNIGVTSDYLLFGDVRAFYSQTISKNNPISSLDTTGEGTEYDFVLFENTGVDGSGNNLLESYADVTGGKVVLVYRGVSNFSAKHEAVEAVGGVACIVVNNKDGSINMDLSGSSATIPGVSVTLATGKAIRGNATPVTDGAGNVLYYTGKVTVGADMFGSGLLGNEYMTMSSFSSWGVPGSLELKPEITAPGGNIYSVNGAIAGGQAYESMSGTSMAAPQIAGMAAVLAQVVREKSLMEKSGALTQRGLIHSLLMSTATPVMDGTNDYYYSVLNQGAGLANVNDAANANSWIIMDASANAGAQDGKVKVELGDDPDRTGVYSFTYTLSNLTEEDGYYSFDTDVFTQDVFDTEVDYEGTINSFYDTATRPLTGAKASYSISGGTAISGGETAWTALDAQTVLDALAGNDLSLLDEGKDYDVDGDGSVTTYDAHLILNMYDMEDAQGVCLPAGGEITVTVTLDVTGCDFSDYPAGAYIEAFTYAKQFSTPEDALGTVHSIPVLGYYGSWTEPSMFDVGTYQQFMSGEETRYPYLYQENGFYGNALTILYAGNKTADVFGGNPYNWEEEYDPARDAFSAVNGDSIYSYQFAPIRNAAASRLTIRNAETGDVYMDTNTGAVTGAFYYTNASYWESTSYNVKFGWKAAGVPDNTPVEVSLTLAPEYYVEGYEEDGYAVVDWDALGDGATMTTRFTIDNTAPTLLSAVHSLATEERGETLTLSVQDNQYIACVGVYDEYGWYVDEQYPEQTAAGQVCSVSVDLSSEYEGENLLVAVLDYAGNQTTYKLTVGDAATSAEPESITMEEALRVAVGGSARLTAEIQPWLADETVIWSSNDDTIATVDSRGVVTGKSEGKTTVTAASAAKPELTATCEVTVVVIDKDLNAVIWDESGNTWYSEFNTTDLPNYTKLTDSASKAHISSLARLNGQLYGAAIDTSSGTTAFYSVEEDTLEATLINANCLSSGYSLMYCDMAEAPNLGENGMLVAVYGYQIAFVNPETGECDWLTSYGFPNFPYSFSFTYFAGITYAGSEYNEEAEQWMDVFYLVDTDGNLYETKVLDNIDEEDGSHYYTYLSGGKVTSQNKIFSGSESADWYFNSLYLDQKTDILYWANFSDNNNCVTLYAYELLDEQVYQYNLGSFNDGVWPVGGLIELDYTADSDHGLPTGGLNVVSVERGTTPKLDKKLTVGNNATISVDVAAEASTNGLLKFAYDADVLTFEKLTCNSKDVLSSYVDDADVLLTLAYAAKDAKDGDIFTVTFSYNENTCPFFTDVDVTTEEENADFEATEVSYRYRLRLTPGAAGNDPVTPVTPTEPTEPTDPTEPEWPFADIPTTHPFYEDIKYVYENGLMNGTSAALFESDLATTRGMIATILYRMEGSPAVTGTCSFTDVLSSQYYTDAVIWAAANGIVTGYDEKTFGPNDLITREQMAAILYRYAQNKGVDVSVGEDTNILSYNDFTSISEYAIPAFQWVCGAGIINGTSATTLSPTANATRGQVAAILHRYCAQLG